MTLEQLELRFALMTTLWELDDLVIGETYAILEDLGLRIQRIYQMRAKW